MKLRTLPFVGLVVALVGVAVAPAAAQQHRAVRLGHPSTRFAPPLTEPEQLRALFADEKLKDDVAEILRQGEYQGNVDDLRRAAAIAPITELSLPIGTRMPYMSSRKDGKPEALKDVLWEGDQPVSAYAFDFISNGRLYRCITPKPCSNFYTVDLGPLQPELTLGCSVPGDAVVGRRFDVCLTVTNRGTAPEPKTILRLPLPAEAMLISITDQGTNEEGVLLWTLAELPPATAKQVCATFVALQATQITFAATAEALDTKPAESRCDTRATGTPAILLETADLDDPIKVGQEVVYEIKVTNQGSAPGTNLKVTCALPDSVEFVSGTGPTPVQAPGRAITMETLAELAPEAQAVWHVTAKALKADDARFKAYVSSDQLQQPIQKDESTHLY